ERAREIPGARPDNTDVAGIGMAVRRAALRVVLEDIHRARDLERHVLHVLRRDASGPYHAQVEITGLALGAGDDQHGLVDGVAADVALPGELAADACRKPGWAHRQQRAFVIINEQIEVAGG